MKQEGKRNILYLIVKVTTIIQPTFSKKPKKLIPKQTSNYSLDWPRSYAVELQSSNLSQNRKNLMDSNKQIHVGSRSKCEAKRRWKKWPLSVDLASISSTLITEDLSPVWKLTNQNYLSDFNLIWKLNQCAWLGMAMGWS